MKAEKKELLSWLERHKHTQAMRDLILRHEFSIDEIKWLQKHLEPHVELKAEYKKESFGK